MKKLIQHTPKDVKEYVQSTHFDQHLIPATQQEHFVNLDAPSLFNSGILKDILIFILEQLALL